MYFSLFLASTAPLNVSATAISATSIRLTWNEPASFNGILHDYSIRYKLSSNSTYGTAISAGLRLVYTVYGLRPFTSYELQVRQSSLYFLAVTVNAMNITTQISLKMNSWTSSIKLILHT